MVTTVGLALISYDVSDKNPEVKAALEKLNYHNSFTLGTSKAYFLPNTTLGHETKSTDEAMDDMKSVCISLGITLEKAVAVRASEFVGI